MNFCEGDRASPETDPHPGTAGEPLHESQSYSLDLKYCVTSVAIAIHMANEACPKNVSTKFWTVAWRLTPQRLGAKGWGSGQKSGRAMVPAGPRLAPQTSKRQKRGVFLHKSPADPCHTLRKYLASGGTESAMLPVERFTHGEPVAPTGYLRSLLKERVFTYCEYLFRPK